MYKINQSLVNDKFVYFIKMIFFLIRQNLKGVPETIYYLHLYWTFWLRKE